jgi:hypothetical protein
MKDATISSRGAQLIVRPFATTRRRLSKLALLFRLLVIFLTKKVKRPASALARAQQVIRALPDHSDQRLEHRGIDGMRIDGMHEPQQCEGIRQEAPSKLGRRQRTT